MIKYAFIRGLVAGLVVFVVAVPLLANSSSDRQPNFVKASEASQSTLQETTVFNGIFAGQTMWDAQHWGNTHRMIQTGIETPSGSRLTHVTWTVLKSEDSFDDYRQVNYNCFDWEKSGGPNWTLYGDDHGGIAIIESDQRGGYSSLDVNSGANAVVFHHGDLIGETNYTRVSRLAFPRLGTYISDRLTDYSGKECIYSNGAISHSTIPRGDIYHVGGFQSEPDNLGEFKVLVYWRYVYDGSEFLWEGPVLIDSSMTPSHLLIASGDRVIYAFGKPRNYGVNRNQYDNDLVYCESTTGGADWITNAGPTAWESGGGFNCTDYIDIDPHRFYIDATGGFDSEGRLHLMYTNPFYSDTEYLLGPCELLHWDEGSPGLNANANVSGGPPEGFVAGTGEHFHTVASAMWLTGQGMDALNGHNPGQWNLFISKPTLAFGDGQTMCDLGPNLDYLYAVYTQFGSYDPLDIDDASANGYQNGNLWLSVSNDGGYSWAPQRCITTDDGTLFGSPTRTPDCDVTAGDTCQSEHWASIAETVNDTLHVFYMGDRDAGSIVYGEGNWSLNDVMYLPIFGGTDGDLCPWIAPCICPPPMLTGDPDCEYHADDDEPVNSETLTISNLGNAVLNYGVGINYISGSGWISFGGYGQSIPVTQIAVGESPHEYDVYMDGTSLDNGLYQAEIEIDNDDPNSPNPFVIAVDFFRADSFICGSGVVMTTPCVALEVSNVESFGRENGQGGMWRYNAVGDDALFNPIFDGSLVIANKTRTALEPDPIVYRDIFPNRTPSNPGFRALEDPKISYDAVANDSVVAANQVTIDSTIGVFVQYLFPQDIDSCEFVRIKYTIDNRGVDAVELIVGAAVDFDCANTGDFGGIVPDYNLVYHHGTDGEATTRYVAGISALTCTAAKNMVVQNAVDYVYPDGGFSDDYIYSQLDANGSSVWAGSAEDIYSILAIDEATLTPGGRAAYQVALVSSVAGEEGVTLPSMPADISDLVATTAKAWKKAFGLDNISVGPNGIIFSDGSITFAATGTHQDGITGGCCGCAFSYEIDPTPVSGSVTLVDHGDCTGSLDFVEVPEGVYTLTLRVEDLCGEQSDEIVMPIEVVIYCNCGLWGDMDLNDQVNPVDVIYAVYCTYKCARPDCGWCYDLEPYPGCPWDRYDVDCNGMINPVDIVHYVNYVYKGHPWVLEGCNDADGDPSTTRDIGCD